jgi:hypothetical protein
MKYGACSSPSGIAVIATGGRQLVGFACGDEQESWALGNPEVKV